MTPQTVSTTTSLLPITFTLRRCMLACLFACAALLICACAHAQEIALPNPPAVSSANVSSSAELPDDPATLLATPQEKPLDGSLTPTAPTTGPVAPRSRGNIPPGWTAQSLTAKDKLVIGMHDTYSLISFAAILSSAGYEQALNGSPNYGTDRGAFGERLGAAGLRETSQTVFTEMVFSPLLHQDPRYYEQGSSHTVVHRVLYAVTRPLIGRTDSGHATLNSALLLGYASAAGLSYTYYPTVNQNFKDTSETFAGSLGGAAIGFVVDEFGHDIFAAMHLAKKR